MKLQTAQYSASFSAFPVNDFSVLYSPIYTYPAIIPNIAENKTRPALNLNPATGHALFIPLHTEP